MARLLVVDDEPGVRESLRMLFKDDCEVVTAASVDEATQLLASSQPDLMLLDLVMPGRGGLDLLAELSELPVIFTEVGVPSLAGAARSTCRARPFGTRCIRSTRSSGRRCPRTSSPRSARSSG